MELSEVEPTDIDGEVKQQINMQTYTGEKLQRQIQGVRGLETNFDMYQPSHLVRLFPPWDLPSFGSLCGISSFSQSTFVVSRLLAGGVKIEVVAFSAPRRRSSHPPTKSVNHGGRMRMVTSTSNPKKTTSSGSFV